MLTSVVVAWLLGLDLGPSQQTVSLEVRTVVPAERFIRPDEGLELTLSRPLTAADGRLAVVIADVDWTSLFTLDGRRLAYRGGAARLPQGESAITVYLVTPPNAWQQIATLQVRVTTPAGFEQVRLTPAADVNNAGQAAESHAPASNAPARATFQDFTSHLGLSTEHVRSGVHMRTQTNLLAVSNQKQTLRFAQAGDQASKLDLADYLWSVEGRHVNVSLGTANVNIERHLAPGLPTRGISGTAKFSRVDVALAAVNGQSIVGFPNFLGVTTADNQIALGVLGAELVPQRPRTARVELSFVSGARLARPGFTQRQINDVLRSHGSGVRFVGGDATQRLRVDSGFARSWSVNPDDPQLSQGLAIVAVKPKTSDAEYVDTAYELVRHQAGQSKTPVTLTGSYRFERVDPLFTSVAAPQGVRSDLLQHTAGMEAAVGQVTGRVSEIWAHDNLREVPSILRTDTGVTAAAVTVPTGAFGQAPTSAVWWPVVSYSLTRSRQIGEGLPSNGGFVSPSQVPDQINTINTLGADWSLARVHLGYSLNHAFQDNRQPGRETSDFSNQAQQLAVGLTPMSGFSVTVTFNREGTTNFELDRVSHTTRGGVILSWQMDAHSTVNATANHTAIADATAGPSDVEDATLQYSYGFRFRSARTAGPALRLFARWTWQSSSALDFLSGVTNERRNWSISTGLTLTIF